MDLSRHRGQSYYASAQSRGMFGKLSARTAQIVAAVTTVLFTSGVSYGLNALFTALGH